MASATSVRKSTHLSRAPSSGPSIVAESEPEQMAPPCWDETAVIEDELDLLVGLKDMPKKASPASSPSGSPFTDVECGCWEDAPNSKCHASFGDQGTTATVGAFGQLIQFSHHLEVGRSGMFCADHASVPEPYYVKDRATKLDELLQQPFHCAPALRDNRFPMLSPSENSSNFSEIFPGGNPCYGLRFPSLVMRPGTQPNFKWIHWRWPCHEYSPGQFQNAPGLKMTIQWIVRNRTVLQRCVFENNGVDDIAFELDFGKTMIIRDLDHLDPHYNFNQDKYGHHDSRPGPGGYSWVCVHKFNTKQDPASFTVHRQSHEHESRHEEPLQDNRPPTVEPELTAHSRTEQAGEIAHDSQDREPSPENSYGISAVSSITIDGRMQKFEDSITPQRWNLVVKAQQSSGGTVEVTVAYTMRFLKAPITDWKDHLIRWDDMRVDRFLREESPGQSISFCDPGPVPSKGSAPSIEQAGQEPQDRLEFAARRHLEHILSVCAVQVTPSTDDTADANVPPALANVAAVALTCGDMSGHRICWSASFFAFRFLVESYGILRCPRNGKHAIFDRIKKTCQGHLKWLHCLQKKNTDQLFGANYWVTGKPLAKPTLSESWVAADSLLDTGFQILKAAACMESWNGNDISAEFAAELMCDWAPPWLLSLENSDKRKKYAWPHAEKEGVNTFRLDEHVWIWRALKSLELNNRQVWDKMLDKARESQLAAPPIWQEASDRQLADREDEILRLRKTFRSEVVQREVSGRFTTENSFLQKRMLATTRSIRESRFMLHARDTALVYNKPFDFLGKDRSVQELWKITVQSQMYHTEYQETNWRKTLRYALYILLGAHDVGMNSTSPDELVRTATDILFRSSSPNGFFPGRIEILTNTPVGASLIAEEDLESYYHASFEIPYILLTHMEQVMAAYKRSKREVPKFRRNSDSMLGGNFPRTGTIPQSIDREKGDAEKALLRHLLRRSRVSDFDNNEVFQDARRTTKKAVPFDQLVDSSNIVKLDDEWLYTYPAFFSRGKVLEISDCDKGLEELERKLKSLEESSVSNALDKNSQKIQFCIVDVPSSKRNEGKRKLHRPTYHKGEFKKLEAALNPTRTAQHSKKRLLNFTVVSKPVALLCYATTEASERWNLKEFFERHSRYSKHTIDNCSMIHNYWESEFHLSYYQLLRGSSGPRYGIATPDSKPFPGGLGMQVVRASASFRFHGDFFDRHWTCYMLDSTHKGPISKPNLLEQRTYCQRKVLEQRYFADILKSLTGSVKEILHEVKTSLGVKSGSFSTSIHTINAYLSWSTLWQEFEPLIQKLDNDLAVTQTIVNRWEAREEDRGKEKPRWTPNDERKYRASIMAIRREVKHQMSRLQHLHEKNKSLYYLCSNRLDKAREDLSFHSEQNIAMFTYVTVVFLPLGFTASIFSMNGTPEKGLAINMVVASTAALVVTIMALWNAKGLISIVETVSKRFKDLTAAKKRSSLIMRGRRELEKKEETSGTGFINTALAESSSTTLGLPDLIFWTSYICIELPARAITTACRTLGWSRDEDKDLEGLQASKRIGPFARSVVASGLRYCLVPSMALLETEAAAVLGRSSMEVPREPAAQLVADDALRKHGYAIRIARVLLGVFMIPVVLPTWIIQIVCFNAWDALSLLGELTRRRIKHISLPNNDGSESSLITHLTKPPEGMRPIKMFKNHLRSKEKLPEGAEEVVSSMEKLSQAAG